MQDEKTLLNRAELRYICYALREGNKPPPGSSKVIKEIEALEGFDGWPNFANTWDFKLTYPNKTLVRPLQVIPKNFTEAEAWNRTVNRLAVNANKPKGKVIVTGKN